jgi:hypothetical protein
MNEVVQALRIVDRVVVETLRGDPEAADLDRALRDHVSTRVEFGIDRVIEVYEDAASFGVDVSR